ncbi:hydroxymethylglutaryl-CoA reductase, degradative [Pseudogracilibacillus sp. SO30301A]|uniref:hydroxymethylglutaryl-CoA reductase, degradative n=1 Tax=Pseudogracilibacillus sp. SO30301A TaxID=3098291 RepID=UPI00300DBFCD
MNSRIPGFFKLSPEERLEKISQELHLSEEDKKVLTGNAGFTVENADRMIENTIGYLPVPLGLAANFKINSKDIFVPMATEEPSVVAAASNASKHAYESGGFTTTYTGSIMRGQIQVTNVKNPYFALAKIYENKGKIMQICNEQDSTLVSLGGGAKDIDVQIVETEIEKMVVVHLLVDTRDAMGANAVNTMAEAVTPFIEEITDGCVVLRILSNLADQRIVRARAIFKDPSLHGEGLKKFMDSYQLALFDPYRAATHNKGIMNGISAVVLATGNDTRAVEAGAHAYAAVSGRYRSLTHWELGENNELIGMIELPLAVGLIGGATQSHPVAKLVTKMLDVSSAEELAGIIAATGLAQNFAALKALAGDGIQKGHMKLHLKNIAVMAGATSEQIDEVVTKAIQKETHRFDDIKAIVEELRQRDRT